MFGSFKVDLITVGSLKQKELRNMSLEYEKRLSSFIKLNIIELKDESNKLSETEVLKKESLLIEKVLDKNSYIILLDINQTQLDSVEFSNKIEHIITYENSKITFIIGGSYGVDNIIKQQCNYRLSFSKMTFPHQLFRIMFLEQLYRSMSIKNNSPYHK